MPIYRRKRLRRLEIAGHARFLTFSCYRRLPLFTNDAVKDDFVRHLDRSRTVAGFRLFGFVVMPEHVHLVFLPNLPDWPVERTLRHVKGQFARRLLARWKTLHAPILDRLVDATGLTRFWQRGGGYDVTLESWSAVVDAVHYCHDNPIARGLVGSASEYPWSSARWYEGVGSVLLSMDGPE